MKRRILAVVALLAAVSLAGTTAQAAPTTTTLPDAKRLTGAPVHIEFGYASTINAAPLFIAQAKGYFKAENLDVHMFPYALTSATAQPLLATGRMDALYSSTSPGFFNGIYNGLDVKLVGSGGLPRKGAPSSAFLALKKGPIKSLSDLRGKKVSTNGGIQSLAAYYLAELLKQVNMTIDDVTIVNLTNDQGAAALQNGAISAALTFQPQITQDIASGEKISLGDIDKVLAKGGGGGFIFGTNLVKKNRRAGVALLRALQKAARVDLQGDWVKNKPTVQTIANATGTYTWSIKQAATPEFRPDLRLGDPVFDLVQTFWQSVHVLTYYKNMKPARYLDDELFKAAVSS